MRISSQQIFLVGLNGILDAQRRVNELQNQVTSGERIQTPADDPIAASRIIALDQQQSVNDQYRVNAGAAQNRLRAEESTLATIEDTLQRVRQLTIQAGDGALSADDRSAIAAEIGQRVEQLLGLVNAQDENGQHLFGGYQSINEPFERNSGGGFNYLGDDGQLLIKVGDNIDVPVSDSGKQLFLDVDEPDDFVASANAGNAGSVIVAGQGVNNQAQFDAFFPDDATITFDTTGPAPVYTVTRVSDGTVVSGGDPLAPLTNIPYNAGDTISFEGVSVILTGVPADGDTIDVTSQPTSKLGMLEAVEKLANGLSGIGQGAGSQLQVNELVSDTLISLDNVLDNVVQGQAKIGARINTVTDAMSLLDNVDLIAQDVRSELKDLDYADAISKLSQQTFILEAAQQSFVKINNLSLFNFIR